MDDIEVIPATAALFDEVEHTLTGGGDGASCQCQWWMLSAQRFRETSRTERTELLARELEEPTPPGLIARLDGTAAGWVRVGPRIRQPRLARTRIVGRSPEPRDADDVWAVSCFSVRRGARGRGVMRALVDGAVGFAREHGARVLEAYPYDTAVADVPANSLYVGVQQVFVDAGFQVVERSTPQRSVVSRTLTPARGDTVNA